MKWNDVYEVKPNKNSLVWVKCAEGDVELVSFYDGEYFWNNDEIIPDVYQWRKE